MRAASVVGAVLLMFHTPIVRAFDCPSEAGVHSAIQHYIETQFWSPGERETWKISDVSGFKFEPVKFGKIIQKQVEFGRNAEDVCPVRVTYSFVVTHADGRVETTTKGENETHWFYLDGFDEWTFKVGS